MKNLLFFFIVLPSIALGGGFDKVTVRMQSGDVVPINSLPWFKFAIVISHGKWADRATSAEWIIVAPPKYCPYGHNYRLQWEGSVTSFKEQTIRSCNDTQYKKLEGLPDDVKKVCSCSILLDNIGSKDGSLWRSHDDDLLNADELRLKSTLIKGEEKLPIMLTLGGKVSGLYDFKGNKLCSYAGKPITPDPNAGAFEKLNSIFSKGADPFDITCFENQKGKIDLSKLSFSVLRGKIVGKAEITFPNQQYFIEID